MRNESFLCRICAMTRRLISQQASNGIEMLAHDRASKIACSSYEFSTSTSQHEHASAEVQRPTFEDTL